jgi:hypothetical protein
VDGKVKTRAASDTNLDGPRGAVRLKSKLAVGGRRRLKVASESITELKGSNHRDCTRDDGANGNGAEAALRGIAVRLIALFAESNETATKEPRTNISRELT